MSDPLILDTNVFSRKDFLNWLDTYHGEIKLPAVAYAEICVKFLKHDGELNKLKYLLDKLNIEIEWLRANEAEISAFWGHKCGDFSENARDYMIGAHAHIPPLKLISSNKRDFSFLGDRVLTPDECIRKLK